jgi:outer membrane protein assembly factor BamB
VPAVALLVAGCTGSSAREDGAAAGSAPAAAAPATTGKSPAARQRHARITVVDGDTGKRVEGVHVVVGREARRSNERGVARVPIFRHGSIPVEVSAPGYVTKRIRLRFSGRRLYTVRIYQRDLQWPFYGATLARTQAHPAIRLRPPFRTVWSRGVGSLVEFPAAVWEGVAYVNTLDGTLYALSMRDGRVLWKQEVGAKTASTPAIDPDSRTLLLTTMSPGDFQVRDLATGKLEWRYPTGLAEPSPIVRDGIAYFAATNGNVYAMDLERREPKWVFSGGAKITSSPALAGGRLYVGDYAGRVFCLDAATGALRWTGSAGSRVYGTVAVAGGRVFAPSVFSGLSALSARTGALLWRIPTSSYLYSSPAVYRGRVFFGNYSGTVSAASAKTGAILWSASAGGSVSGAVQVVDGVVYAGSFGGVITGWDWRSGRQLFRFPHGEYVAVSGNGGRLLLHGYSKIYAVEPAGGS